PDRCPALRAPYRADLLWSVAGPAGLSGVQVRVVPQGAGRRAPPRGCLLPRGHARGIPRSRHWQSDPWLCDNSVRNRGDLDGWIPARDWREDLNATRAPRSPGGQIMIDTKPTTNGQG